MVSSQWLPPGGSRSSENHQSGLGKGKEACAFRCKKSEEACFNNEESWSTKMVVPRDMVCTTPYADSALSVWVSDRKLTDLSEANVLRKRLLLLNSPRNE